jgi:hypothetical protein
MTPNDRTAFADLITGALAFWRQSVSPFSLSVWWQACSPFELEQVAKALTAHAIDADRGRFAPMPADIVRQLQGTQVDRSLLAWGKVYDAIRAVGAYRSVAFDDPAIHAAVEDMGGWPTLCRSQVDELPHMQRRFCDLHRAYSARGEPDRYPPRLVGEHEAANERAGKAVEPPVLVGDPALAERVMRGGLAGPKTKLTLLAGSAVTMAREHRA